MNRAIAPLAALLVIFATQSASPQSDPQAILDHLIRRGLQDLEDQDRRAAERRAEQERQAERRRFLDELFPDASMSKPTKVRPAPPARTRAEILADFDEAPPPTGPARVTGSVRCDNGGVGIDMNIIGDIDPSTVDRVKSLLATLDERKRTIANGSAPCTESGPSFGLSNKSFFQINSRGGNVLAAMAIGRMFRKENAWIQVQGSCISACVLILAGAVDRFIDKSAQIGIHRPYFSTTPNKPLEPDQVRKAYGQMLQDIRTYLREMNVSERLADDMLDTAPQSVRFLTRAELVAYDLAGVDPAERRRRAIAQEARDVKEANDLGLDRMEYNRRKALGDNVCVYKEGTDFVCKRRVMSTGR
jgi:hypothetical protein